MVMADNLWGSSADHGGMMATVASLKAKAGRLWHPPTRVLRSTQLLSHKQTYQQAQGEGTGADANTRQWAWGACFATPQQKNGSFILQLRLLDFVIPQEGAPI